MSRVVIAARTRMRPGEVCIGAHDLDRRFLSLRLLDRFGGHCEADLPFKVGELWDVQYDRKGAVRAPHLEDVYVMQQRRLEPVADLKGLVLRWAHPWTGAPTVLFDGTVRHIPSGSAYVPAGGRLPNRSTGYWIPDQGLVCHRFGSRVRFDWQGPGEIKRLVWVGVAAPPARIDAGSLVRVSLTRCFGSETAPHGYYVQISGVL